MMKNLKYTLASIALIISLSIVVTSCDSGFDAMNTSKIAINELDPTPVLNHAIWRTSPGSAGRATMLYEKAIVQHMITPFAGGLEAGNYQVENRGHAAQSWNNHYPQIIKHAVDVIHRTREQPNRQNMHNMAKIIRAYSGLTLTDIYGEIPYSQAGLGFIEGVTDVAYDTQSDVYNAALSELRDATNALSTSSRIETGDVLYNGNIDRWKRFGNSIILRHAMRLTKVDPAKAREYVQIAVSGGVIQSNADNALVRHTSNFQYNIGTQLNSSEAANFYMTKPLVDLFKANNDPRLGALGIRYVGATGGGSQTAARATRNPADQIGMPMGYSHLSIPPRAQSDGVGSLFGYTQFNRATIGKNTAPYFIVTHAQTQFLLAEAVERGWISGNSADLYASGIRAHMAQLASIDANLTIANSEIEAFIQSQLQVYNSSNNKIELINTEYWIASLFNATEAWGNFRRSGYPALEPNPFPGSAIPRGSFIRRLLYPAGEQQNNAANLNAAISRQGPDALDTRLWWDRP